MSRLWKVRMPSLHNLNLTSRISYVCASYQAEYLCIILLVSSCFLRYFHLGTLRSPFYAARFSSLSTFLAPEPESHMSANGQTQQAFAPVITALATLQSADRSQKGQAHEYLEVFQKSVSDHCSLNTVICARIFTDELPGSPRHGPSRLISYKLLE